LLQTGSLPDGLPAEARPDWQGWQSGELILMEVMSTKNQFYIEFGLLGFRNLFFPVNKKGEQQNLPSKL